MELPSFLYYDSLMHKVKQGEMRLPLIFQWKLTLIACMKYYDTLPRRFVGKQESRGRK